MTRKQKYRRFLIVLFLVSVVFTGVFSYYYMLRMIPNHLNIVVNEHGEFNFRLPLGAKLSTESEEVVLGNGSNIPSNEIRISSNEPFSIYSKNRGRYTLGLKLFGWLEFKNIQVDVVDTQYAVPCGFPIGIYLESDGILVIGTGEVSDKSGSVVEPAYGILKSGDYIREVNHKVIADKEELIQMVQDSRGQDLVLTVRRKDQWMDVRVTPVCSEAGEYKLGVWVRDDTQGIGTLTYIDAHGNFGALGHGISDSDTGDVVEVSGGNLYQTEIKAVEKGKIGKPGVMSGVIYYGDDSLLGDIRKNTTEGIFGTANSKLRAMADAAPVKIGYKQEIHTGEAWVRSSISGHSKDYKIKILKVDTSNSNKNKGLVIQVVDEELLALTGGIVQGMSGSPILQDGKLIGAVTHVFIQDSTKGYGIFVENMLKH